MVRCSNCGWANPEGLKYCEKCNATLTFDVFISYSRKDYVDDAGNVLENNILSKIKDALKANGFSYWFDEEGIYSGDEFASVLTNAIRNSRIFLFISSVNSNQSKWTSNEISTALEFKKTIIPLRLDSSPYNDSVMMKIVSFDYIECNDVEKAMSKLPRAIKHHLPSSIRQQKKSIIDVPDGAKGATVIFDIGGKRTEKVFSYKDGEANILHEKATPVDHRFIQDSTKSNRFKLLKNWNALWLLITAILFVMISGGLIVFCHEGILKNTPRAIYERNEPIECQPVDLGLPSGTMWADRNVGAKSNYDFGALYAWGEISIKKSYYQKTYNYTDKPKNCSASAKYDVATALLGAEWMIPTERQFKELLNECQWRWTQINGHRGFEISGKNGNKIFIPAAGKICNTTIDYQNHSGYYWTCERSTTNPQFARSLLFRNKKGEGYMGNGYLHYGRSVRAVYKGLAVAE